MTGDNKEPVWVRRLRDQAQAPDAVVQAPPEPKAPMSVDAGSCNACTEIVNNPNAYSTVTVLNLRGLSVRLCPTCLSTLKKAL